MRAAGRGLGDVEGRNMSKETARKAFAFTVLIIGAISFPSYPCMGAALAIIAFCLYFSV